MALIGQGGQSVAEVANRAYWKLAFDGSASHWEFRCAAIFTEVSKRLLVFGANDKHSNTELFVLDVPALEAGNVKWARAETSGSAPPPSDYYVCCVHRHEVYVLWQRPANREWGLDGWKPLRAGTRQSSPGAVISVLCPATMTWTVCSPATDTVPTCIRGYSCVATEHHIIIFGGIGVDGSLNNETFTFDVARRTWSKVAVMGELPPPVEGHSAVLLRVPPLEVRTQGAWEAQWCSTQIEGLTMVIYGGRCGGGRCSGQMFVLSLSTRFWVRINTYDPPGPRADIALAVCPSEWTLVAFGGQDASRKATNDTFVFRFPTSQWCQVPINKYHPKPRIDSFCGCVDELEGSFLLFSGREGQSSHYYYDINTLYLKAPLANSSSGAALTNAPTAHLHPPSSQLRATAVQSPPMPPNLMHEDPFRTQDMREQVANALSAFEQTLQHNPVHIMHQKSAQELDQNMAQERIKLHHMIRQQHQDVQEEWKALQKMLGDEREEWERLYILWENQFRDVREAERQKEQSLLEMYIKERSERERMLIQMRENELETVRLEQERFLKESYTQLKAVQHEKEQQLAAERDLLERELEERRKEEEKLRMDRLHEEKLDRERKEKDERDRKEKEYEIRRHREERERAAREEDERRWKEEQARELQDVTFQLFELARRERERIQSDVEKIRDRDAKEREKQRDEFEQAMERERSRREKEWNDKMNLLRKQEDQVSSLTKEFESLKRENFTLTSAVQQLTIRATEQMDEQRGERQKLIEELFRERDALKEEWSKLNRDRDAQHDKLRFIEDKVKELQQYGAECDKQAEKVGTLLMQKQNEMGELREWEAKVSEKEIKVRESLVLQQKAAAEQERIKLDGHAQHLDSELRRRAAELDRQELELMSKVEKLKLEESARMMAVEKTLMELANRQKEIARNLSELQLNTSVDVEQQQVLLQQQELKLREQLDELGKTEEERYVQRERVLREVLEEQSRLDEQQRVLKDTVHHLASRLQENQTQHSAHVRELNDITRDNIQKDLEILKRQRVHYEPPPRIRKEIQSQIQTLQTSMNTLWNEQSEKFKAEQLKLFQTLDYQKRYNGLFNDEYSARNQLLEMESQVRTLLERDIVSFKSHFQQGISKRSERHAERRLEEKRSAEERRRPMGTTELQISELEKERDWLITEQERVTVRLDQLQKEKSHFVQRNDSVAAARAERERQQLEQEFLHTLRHLNRIKIAISEIKARPKHRQVPDSDDEIAEHKRKIAAAEHEREQLARERQQIALERQKLQQQKMLLKG